jgi:hypothetical protein
MSVGAATSVQIQSFSVSTSASVTIADEQLLSLSGQLKVTNATVVRDQHLNALPLALPCEI